jgi:hypothetical protein
MDEKYLRKKVEEGRAFEYTAQTEGFKDVLIPRVKNLLKESDIKCHPSSSQFRVDVLKYHVGYYNGVMDILNEIEMISKEKDNALRELSDKGILT